MADGRSLPFEPWENTQKLLTHSSIREGRISADTNTSVYGANVEMTGCHTVTIVALRVVGNPETGQPGMFYDRLIAGSSARHISLWHNSFIT